MHSQAKRSFQPTVWKYYLASGRHDLPWRQCEPDGSFDPYKIMVSEVMLQQTQVPRVIMKYQEFLSRFPTVQILARAKMGDTLRAWNGLGYNRRAKFLHQAAQKVAHDYRGRFPDQQAELIKLPGVGRNTAGAILAYAFNEPVAFLETNIRTVFIHHFFRGQTGIPDQDILKLVEQTLPRTAPSAVHGGMYREWYWALMDYGSFLKQTEGNLSRHSTAYAKQSKFEGSKRQIRGQIIRLLGERPHTQAELCRYIPDQRREAVIQELLREELIKLNGSTLTL